MSTYKGNSTVKLTRPERSVFDLGKYRRDTAALGRLIPIHVEECLPGDVIKGGQEILVRLAPTLAPFYDVLTLFVHTFFVPHRLLWADWEEFITGGRLGVGEDPIIAPIPPYFQMQESITGGLFEKYTLVDYMGIPVISAANAGAWAGKTLDLMPFVAYQLLWYEYYRDRNFVSDDVFEFPVPSGDFADPQDWLTIRDRDMMKDYFTAALPNIQRGVEVLMPLAGTAVANYFPTSLIKTAAGDEATILTLAGVGNDEGAFAVNKTSASDPGVDGRIENIQSIDIDSSAVSINDFRSAYALQVWLERNEIAGSRYTESLQAHWAVKPQDSRLQRPEYLGGQRATINVSEVVSTAASTFDESQVPQANMAGHGIAYANQGSFRYYCAEYGFCISILSIMPVATYQQGLPKMFRRKSFLDYPWPTFAKLGEQPVWDWEIFWSPATFTEDEAGEYTVFGYQSRYADWKQRQNSNHGDFRDSLLFWSLTTPFDDVPTLGTAFLSSNRIDAGQIFAVDAPQGQNFWLYSKIHFIVKRMLPYYGTPNTLNF